MTKPNGQEKTAEAKTIRLVSPPGASIRYNVEEIEAYSRTVAEAAAVIRKEIDSEGWQEDWDADKIRAASARIEESTAALTLH